MIATVMECRGRKCTWTVLHEGVYRQTSTTHECGNKMKRRKEKKSQLASCNNDLTS